MFEQAEKILLRAIELTQIPGAVLRVERAGDVIYEKALGLRHTSPERPMQTDTLFDLASLTKVTVTLGIVLSMFNRGQIQPETALGEILPVPEDKKRITIRQCLTHTAGFPASVRLKQSIEEIYDVPLAYMPGSSVLYSDLGFILLGQIIERVSGMQLKRSAHDHLKAWGLHDSCYHPAQPDRCAATEWREQLGRHQLGEVHDENASVLGGVAGHAGLFSTAADLCRYASLYLKAKSDDWFYKSRMPAAEGFSERRGLGWLLTQPGCFAGQLASDKAFGHTGFTGTSLWVEPALDSVIVLLTNRVHYGREPYILSIREQVHTEIYRGLEA